MTRVRRAASTRPRRRHPWVAAEAGGRHFRTTLVVQLIDDLDGTPAADTSTVTFGLDGVAHEIDLTGANADELRARLDDYIAAARRIGGRTRRGTAGKAAAPVANREQTKATRDRARQNGFDLSDRGRIPSHLTEAYDAAHAKK